MYVFAIVRTSTSFAVNIVFNIHAIFTSHLLPLNSNFAEFNICEFFDVSVSRMESRAVSMFAHVVNIMNLVGSA